MGSTKSKVKRSVSDKRAMAAEKYSFQMDEDPAEESVDRQSHLATLARNILVLINSITLLAGLSVLALGTFAYVQYTSNFSELVSEPLVVSIIILGAIIAFISVVGLHGSIVHSRRSLFLYVIVVLGIIAAQAIGATMTIQYMGLVDKVASADSVAGSLTDRTEIDINNYLLSTYHACCVTDEDYCSVLSSRQNFCEPAKRCEDSDNSTTVCYTNLASDAELPPIDVEQAVCTTLETIAKVNGRAIVGDSSNGYSCGGGNAVEYFRNFFAWFMQNIIIVRDIFIVVSSIEVMSVVLSVVLLCIKPPDAEDGQKIAHMDSPVEYVSPLSMRMSSRASTQASSRLSNNVSVSRSERLANREAMINREHSLNRDAARSQSASARASARLSNRNAVASMRFDNELL